MLDLRFITRRSTFTKLAGGALLVMAVAPAQPLADSGFWPLRPSSRSTRGPSSASAPATQPAPQPAAAGMIEIQQAKADIADGKVKPPMPSWLVDQPDRRATSDRGVATASQAQPDQPSWLELAEYQSVPAQGTGPNRTGPNHAGQPSDSANQPGSVAQTSGFFPALGGRQMLSAQHGPVQHASPGAGWQGDASLASRVGSTVAPPSGTGSNKSVELDFNQPPALARSTANVPTPDRAGEALQPRRSFFPSPAGPASGAVLDSLQMIAQDQRVTGEAPPTATLPTATLPTATLPTGAFPIAEPETVAAASPAPTASPAQTIESATEPPAADRYANHLAPRVSLPSETNAAPNTTIPSQLGPPVSAPVPTPGLAPESATPNALATADPMVLPPIEAAGKSSVQFADLVSDTQREDLGVNQVATFDLIDQDSFTPDSSPSDRVLASHPVSDLSQPGQQEPIALPPVATSELATIRPNDPSEQLIGSQAISGVDVDAATGRPRILFQPAVPARDAAGRSILRPTISVAALIGQDQGAESVVEIIDASQGQSGSVLELPVEDSQSEVLWIPAPLRDHSLPVRQRAWQLVRSGARALKTKPRYDAGVGQERLAFALFEMDAAQPNNNFRIRTQAAYNWEYPDRAEYLWSRIGGKGPGVSIPPETSVDFQDFRLAMEVGGARFSMTTEIPLRFINPTSTPNTGGMGDMVTVAKTLMMDKERFKLSQVLLTQMPTGTPSKGRGNGHVSMEPGFVSSFAWTDRTIINNELKLWFPLGGEPGFSGPVLRYGAGFAHLWYDSDQFAIIPTFEIVGWSALNGQKTNEFGLTETYDGENILNLYPGLRLVSDRSSSGTVFELGLNGGFTISERHWYDKIIRLDARWTF